MTAQHPMSAAWRIGKKGGRWSPDEAETQLLDQMADALDAMQARCDAQISALQEARPVVANAVAETDQPWRRETRERILKVIDAILATERAHREGEGS